MPANALCPRGLAALGLAALLTVSLLGAVPAAAHPLPHGDEPRIVDLDPAPGGVVEAGTVRLAASAVADQPVTDHEVRVNGGTVDATRGDGTHARITAEVSLDAGRHEVEFSATTEHGSTSRAWQIRAADLPAERLAGSDRLRTAVAVSEALYDDGEAASAVLARADDFPDALAGAPVAREVDGPLLLTASDELSGPARAELERVLAPDATVHLLGGEGALGSGVASDVADLGVDVARLAGASRFDTAVEAARMVPETGTAFVASGGDFPDALAAAAIAGDRGWPIVLTAEHELPDSVAAYLDDAAFEQLYLVGGSGVVSDAVQAELGRRVDAVERVAGSTRFATAERLSARFAHGADTAGVASGTDFPDALAGGVHAAAHDAPLLLVGGDRVFESQREQVRDLAPGQLHVYGGTAAVSDVAVEGLRAASLESGELRVTSASLRHGATIDELDQVVFGFDHAIHLDESAIYLTIGGHEVAGSVSHDGSADTLRFDVTELPEDVEHGETHEVHVRLMATSVGRVVHDHLTVDFRRAPRDLSRGANGEEVAQLQRTLRDRGFWLPAATGEFGSHTHHAVVALQKAYGLERDGVVGPTTRRVIADGGAAPAPRYGSSRAYEIDLERGLVLFVDGGETRWAFDASAGHGEVYQFQGSTFRANTTDGSHRVVRQVDGIREAARGELYRPKYFDNSRGIAIHGYTSVPPYNASSGCVRVTNAAMDQLWRMDPGLGTPVHVYPVGYYG